MTTSRDLMINSGFVFDNNVERSTIEGENNMGKIHELILMEQRILKLKRMLKRNPGQHWEAHAKGLVSMLNKKVAAIRITF